LSHEPRGGGELRKIRKSRTNLFCRLIGHKWVRAGSNGSYLYLICKRLVCRDAKWVVRQ
jgi:hypothetical protein